MTMLASVFDLYLLSRMRAAAQMTAALDRMGSNRAEMDAAVATVELSGLTEMAVPVQRYIDVLGAPVREDPPDRAGDDESSFGKVPRLRFRRPPWPGFDFAVGVGAGGYAYGLGFLRSIGEPLPPLQSAADLAPWRFVRSEIVARFGPPRTEDAWSGWEDLSFEMPAHPAGPLQRYLLRFDYDLLQDHLAFGDTAREDRDAHDE